jgi:catechol 2,3-dioxygenase
MPGNIRPKLTHLGLYVQDLARMVEFYTGVLGLLVTDRGRGTAMPVDLVFLSAEADKHHQIVLASGRAAESVSTINQLSFSVDTLDGLREMQARALRFGARDMRLINHGNAWSIYFKDLEGNTIEIYLDSPFHVPQPHFDPLDLSLSDAEILRQTEEFCRRDPGFMIRSEWIKAMESRLQATGSEA